MIYYSAEKIERGEKQKMKKSFKILAIGNSFSVDAMEYLFRVAESAGEKNIVIGNLYIPGCSLDIHWGNMLTHANVYQYYKNTDGRWNSTMWHTLYRALVDEEWDVITMQQASGYSGKPETYSHLKELAEYVKENKPASAKLFWHMTWAYQGDSNHGHFAFYDKDQMKMYNCICDAVKTQVLPLGLFEGVIPCGTTVQNMRTGSLGDTMTRDGFHMSLPVGRYATAVTYYCAVKGCPAANVKTDLTGLISRKVLGEVRRSVDAAIANNFEVTPLK